VSLGNPAVVDFLGTLPDRSAVVLTLVDDWDWTDEVRHLRALQQKLDAYFAFIESGEMLVAYPDAVGKEVVIELISRLPIPNLGLELLEVASAVAAALPARLTYRVVADFAQRAVDAN
jgi:Family of unknown function (DUF6572)